jgi:hypothetical protein
MRLEQRAALMTNSMLVRRICTHPKFLCNTFSQIFFLTQGQFGALRRAVHWLHRFFAAPAQR